MNTIWFRSTFYLMRISSVQLARSSLSIYPSQQRNSWLFICSIFGLFLTITIWRRLRTDFPASISQCWTLLQLPLRGLHSTLRYECLDSCFSPQSWLNSNLRLIPLSEGFWYTIGFWNTCLWRFIRTCWC